MRLNLNEVSKNYTVRRLSKTDVVSIQQLCEKNTLYYEYCPPFVTQESILEDMNVLPPGKTKQDKYYIGYFDAKQLIAVMDIIVNYPHKHTAFIGFFMTDCAVQKQGIGSQIIDDLIRYLVTLRIHTIQLGWVKNNPQASHFWLKNQFIETKVTTNLRGDTTVMAVRKLNECH